MISHTTPAGLSPARRHRSTIASVCPARFRHAARRGAQRKDVSRPREVLGAASPDRPRRGSCARDRPPRCPSSRRARASIETQNAVPRRAVFSCTIGGICSASRRSAVIGRQMRPRPCVAMKLTISGVTNSAAHGEVALVLAVLVVEDRRSTRPARRSSSASSTAANRGSSRSVRSSSSLAHQALKIPRDEVRLHVEAVPGR